MSAISKPVFKRISESDKKEFENSFCLLVISVGQQTHENEMFSKTIELVHESFKNYTILLHDSLQRYTMAISQKVPIDQLYEKTLSLGDDWLARNEQFYKHYDKQPIIIRWGELLNDADFSKYQSKIISMINNDETYKDKFNETIDGYLNRCRKRLDAFEDSDEQRIRGLSMDYLIEECAGLCLWPKTKCHFELYTGKHNAAMDETRKRFITPYYPDLVRPITIEFNRRSSLKPQDLKN